MPTGPGPGVAGAPPGPDPHLLAASAMVFVGDPAAPVLTEDDLRHLIDVLRLRSGELVIAGDGAGSWAPCRVGAGVGPRGSRGMDPASALSVEGPVAFQPRPAPEITVAFAPAKGDRPEWVTQKLTEVGVDRIVPLRVARSVVRWEGERGRQAVARLHRVARQAAAQCRRVWLPEVTEVTPLDRLAPVTGGYPQLAQPGGCRLSLVRPVVAVGPEGGWDADELDRFGPGVGLGPNVLRAETAAVAVGTLLCALRSGAVGPLA